MENKVISIDGPSGSGKTSIGKMLSKRLDAHFLSSGLIYRLLVVSISNISKDDAYKKYINDSDEKKFSELIISCKRFPLICIIIALEVAP